MLKNLIFLSILFISCGQAINSTNSNNDSTQKLDSTLTSTSFALKDTTVKVLWREDVYDTTLQDSVSTIVLNDNYFKNISEPEKAAIAYVATFVGSDCNWDGQANNSFTNLNCNVIKALNLGYQCSDKHLSFLRQWFRSDTAFLNKLKDCPIVPFTATHQNTFDYLTIKTNSDSIKVDYLAAWTSGPDAGSGEWTENVLFRVDNEQLTVLSKKTKKSS